MRAREFIVEQKDQRLDEFLPALAAAGGALSRGVAAGVNAAATVGGALARGAGSVANTVGNAVTNVGNAITKGTQAVGNTVSNVAQQAPQAVAKTTANVKRGIDGIKNTLQQAGGGTVDSSRLSKTLATSQPGQPLNPQAQKDIQAMLPGLADALKDPNAANSIRQAISTGVKSDQQQQQQQAQGTVGTAGSV
jgi:hypothetical protein